MANLTLLLRATRVGLMAASTLVAQSYLYAQQEQTPPPSTTAPAKDAPAAPAAQLPDTPSSSANTTGAQQGAKVSSNGQNIQKNPSGTAAAQTGTLSGTAVSRPAGVAIAPAKQKRSRSLAIKLGLIAGAGIALGTVAALSAAGGGKPPGAP